MRPFDVVPVLDLRNGMVVRGVAGQRDQYRPNQSCWTTSSDPLETACALRKQFNLNRFYIADLDAIENRGSHLNDLLRLQAQGFELLLDAGISQIQQAWQYMGHGLCDLVIGLETLTDWALLEDLSHISDHVRLTFSIDLKQGSPLGPLGRQSPLELVAHAWQFGVRRFIVLDLSAVGTGQGVPTLHLCRSIRERFPDSHLITGGGVRNRQDLNAVREAEVDGVLIASALHDGQLTTL